MRCVHVGSPQTTLPPWSYTVYCNVNWFNGTVARLRLAASKSSLREMLFLGGHPPLVSWKKRAEVRGLARLPRLRLPNET